MTRTITHIKRDLEEAEKYKDIEKQLQLVKEYLQLQRVSGYEVFISDSIESDSLGPRKLDSDIHR